MEIIKFKLNLFVCKSERARESVVILCILCVFEHRIQGVSNANEFMNSAEAISICIAYNKHWIM